MGTLSEILTPELLKIAIPVVVIIVLVIIACKVTGKLFKAIVAIIFVGFVIYLFSGENIIAKILEILGKAPETADMLGKLIL